MGPPGLRSKIFFDLLTRSSNSTVHRPTPFTELTAERGALLISTVRLRLWHCGDLSVLGQKGEERWPCHAFWKEG
eukprot:COSAG02_NODE_26820_length_623_cov_1.574427_2_plen_75_part_00